MVRGISKTSERSSLRGEPVPVMRHTTSHRNAHISAQRRDRGTISSVRPSRRGRVCVLRQLTATLTATLTDPGQPYEWKGSVGTMCRARLPVEARSDGAVFGQTYRLAVQVMERRELLDLTQTELAEKTGIDQGDISRIGRGSIFPNEKTLIRLADALGAEWRMVDKTTPSTQLQCRRRATERPRKWRRAANTCL